MYNNNKIYKIKWIFYNKIKKIVLKLRIYYNYKTIIIVNKKKR